MFQKILCPVDGSDHSDKALVLAGDLASRYGARVTVMHVASADSTDTSGLRQFAESEHLTSRETPPRMPAGGSASEVVASAGTLAHDESRRAETAARMGEQVLDDARQRVPANVPVDTVLAHGNPPRAILEEARTREADVIVMGSRGRSRLGSLLLGSVSGEVSHAAPCTCVTVR